MRLTKAQRLTAIICISSCFFLAEIGVGFYTHSLAVVSDAFHYLNDLVGFVIALVALKISQRANSPKELSFGWQRATLLGAFFNGVFLLALGVSIFLQAIQRFVSIQKVENPEVVLIIGCVGLALNIVSASFLHDHDEDVKTAVNSGGQPIETDISLPQNPLNHNEHRHETRPDQGNSHSGHDLGMAGVLLHVLGDAANNVGVIIAAVVIWKTDSDARYYADPAVSVAIALMIFVTSLPLVKKTGVILMESVPRGVNPYDVMHDIQQLPGVISVHELHIWRLNQHKSIASAHIVTTETSLAKFTALAETITECFHAYGVHSATLQPELARPLAALPDGQSTAIGDADGAAAASLRQRRPEDYICRIGCKMTACEELTCCG